MPAVIKLICEFGCMLQYKSHVAQRDIVLNVDACVSQVFELLCITVLPIFDFQWLSFIFAASKENVSYGWKINLQ